MSFNDYIYWQTVYETGKTPEEIYKYEHPEVVRCKDCKHASDNKVYGCMFNHFNDNDYHRMYSDDYCSHGERKTDD